MEKINVIKEVRDIVWHLNKSIQELEDKSGLIADFNFRPLMKNMKEKEYLEEAQKIFESFTDALHSLERCLEIEEEKINRNIYKNY